MRERHYDRGTLYDNLPRKEFMQQVSPDQAFLNPGRDFYDSDIEYFEALISAEFEDSRTVKPDPFGDKIELYEAPGIVVAVGEEVEIYELRPTAHQIHDVYGEMTSEYSGSVSKVEKLSLEQGVEEAVEAVFERI